MIEGIGVDIVSVERIKKIYERFGRKFLDRVFTEGEIAYSFSYSNPFCHLAARFAVKEAVIKALKKPSGLTLKHIEVKNNSDGSPEVKIEGLNRKIFVSLSHEKKYTVAMVIII
ncbi:MAG: holo-ACP synthase [Thermodesulfovibrio sp.]|jgi:holo-[acyl-carrier protein] synthase|uniref:Holo-[acyl-carrier-protein] synthase n=2 Tax=Thermodesulfovibrio TaxID=28261 RepID=A0A2J6WPZ1_9BACT|nr:MAG: holo-[acyl-carrier-protein] synthase [Thermodesulfovibrio aggregans]